MTNECITKKPDCTQGHALRQLGHVPDACPGNNHADHYAVPEPKEDDLASLVPEAVLVQDLYARHRNKSARHKDGVAQCEHHRVAAHE